MTATTIRVQMAQRKDTAANWTAANPILLSGEIGYETDTKKFKIGNGSSNWNSLAYLPIPDGSGNLTITGNLEIGSTGSLTFEGSTADGFETTLAVTNPTADRTITLPDRSGTVITSGDTGTVTSTMLADGTIVNADISATAEIAVSKLANGTANQIITTDGTDVSWSSNLNLAGNATIQGDLTVNGTTTTIDSQTLLVEDKNIEMGVVATPTDVTADGGGITLRGTTNKTINWIDSTDSWTSSEHVDLTSGKSYRINNTEVLSSTTLGSGVTGSSLTSVGTIGTGVWQGTAISATYLDATLVKTSDTGTVTSTMIANGTIVDADINASAAIADTKLATISTAGKVANSATTATNANTASAIVARDASGNFSAGTITANLTGTASAIADSSVTDAKVSATAAIAGTKISPDFGSQNVTTTGTATAASLIPSSSTVPTNGVYLPAANTVGISTGGSGRLFVDASGNVGVGATPSYALDVTRGSGNGIAARFRNTGGAAGYVYTSGTDTVYFTGDTAGNNSIGFNSTNNYVSIFSGSSGIERIRVTSAGLVGIGTSSPSTILHVNTSVNNSSNYYLDAGATALIRNDNASGITSLKLSSSGNSTSALVWGGTGSETLIFANRDVERARIDSSGRLLVGTSSYSFAATAVLQGNSSASNEDAALRMNRGGTPGANADLGLITFGDNAGNIGATIRATNDTASSWGSGDYPGRLTFSTTADGASSPTERMRIQSTGKTTIFAASGQNVIGVHTASAAGTTDYAFYVGSSATSTTAFSATNLGIFTNGNVVNTNNSYGAISDVKLKENIVDAASQWDDIKALQVRKYNFKEGQTHTQIGLVAQEVELVSPGLVSESPDRDAEGNDLGTVTKSVNYSVLYMKAVKALQEAMERIETLEARLTAAGL